MASLDPKTAEQITKRPRYIETMGESCPMSVTRITREAIEGESATRDYEFSRKSIEQHIAAGYALAEKTLKAAGHSSEERVKVLDLARDLDADPKERAV
jgi:hypothetical protein